MMVLERVLRSALISEDTYMEKSEIVSPKSNTQVYWLYNELANLLTKQKKLHEVLSTFRNGQDAIWSSQDPLPFIGKYISFFLDNAPKDTLSKRERFFYIVLQIHKIWLDVAKYY